MRYKKVLFVLKRNLIYDMEGIDSNILKKAAVVLRKRALELNSSEDYSELRSIFESVGGIPTRIKVLRLLNGREEAWTELFTTIDDNFLNSNTKPIMIDSNGTNAYFKTNDK